MFVIEHGTGELRFERERLWIAYCKWRGFDLLNATDGTGALVSPDARKRAGIKLKDRIFSPLHRQRISEARRGKPRKDAAAIAERNRAMGPHLRGKKLKISDEEREARRERGKVQGPINSQKRWSKMSEEDRSELSKKAKEQVSNVWAARSDDERAAIGRKISATKRRNATA
jgi:hypothetical protein